MKCQTGNTHNGGTILPLANVMADSESGSPDSYSSFLVTIHLSCLVLEIFVSDREMDGQTSVDHYYSWPPQLTEVEAIRHKPQKMEGN